MVKKMPDSFYQEANDFLAKWYIKPIFNYLWQKEMKDGKKGARTRELINIFKEKKRVDGRSSLSKQAVLKILKKLEMLGLIEKVVVSHKEVYYRPSRIIKMIENRKKLCEEFLKEHPKLKTKPISEWDAQTFTKFINKCKERMPRVSSRDLEKQYFLLNKLHKMQDIFEIKQKPETHQFSFMNITIYGINPNTLPSRKIMGIYAKISQISQIIDEISDLAGCDDFFVVGKPLKPQKPAIYSYSDIKKTVAFL